MASTVWHPRSKYLALAFVATMIAVVLHKDLALLHPSGAAAEHYRPIRWWLVPHGLAGVLVIFLGPFQFSERLRRRWRSIHRGVGRVYVTCAVIAAPLGAYIEWIKLEHGDGSRALVTSSSGDAILLATTTLVAFRMTRHRDTAAHKRWMIRSYCAALIFLEVRCVDESSVLTALLDRPVRALDARGISDLWLYIVLAPIFAQIVIEIDALFRRRGGLLLRSRSSAVASSTLEV
jgi:uncharacterized membrane protein